MKQCAVYPPADFRQSAWALATTLLRATALVVLVVLACLLVANTPLPDSLGGITPLTLFWKLIVPLVPAMLLVSPAFWRSICPLAALNIAGHRLRCSLDARNPGQRRYQLNLHRNGGQTWLAKHGLKLAAGLLIILVPARLILLNTNAQVLSGLLALLALMALVAGFLLPFKSGWCSSICPVYPVEQAYGMSPLLQADNTWCRQRSAATGKVLSCHGCTLNCLDTKPFGQSPSAMNWRPSRSLSWFISVFPGFVAAYYLLDRSTEIVLLAMPAKCVTIYSVFVAMMALSALFYSMLTRCLSTRAGERKFTQRRDLLFVAAAFNIYYLMAIPSAAATASALLGAGELFRFIATGLLFPTVWLLTVTWLRRSW